MLVAKIEKIDKSMEPKNDKKLTKTEKNKKTEKKKREIEKKREKMVAAVYAPPGAGRSVVDGNGMSNF